MLSSSRKPNDDKSTLRSRNAYQLLLKRAADPSSVFWVNALNSGSTPASVVLGIESSSEYLNDQVFVLYGRYLERTPESSGCPVLD